MNKIKVEVISESRVYDFERRCNKFIVEHNIKDISFQTTSTAHNVYYTAYITYII